MVANSRCWPLSLLAAGILSSPSAAQRAEPAPFTRATLEELLRTRVAIGRNPGIVAVQVTPAGTVHAVAGRADSPDGKPLSARTLFEIGSITKVITGTLFADAVARGEVREDERLLDVLPSLVLPSGAEAITLLDLATHRSGLASYPVGHRPANARDPWADVSDSVVTASFARAGALRFAPGTRAEYSNIGAGLLGQALVARARAHDPQVRDFASLVQRRIAQPLGLRDFRMTLTPEQTARFATGVNAEGPTAHWHIEYLGAAGAIISSLDDMTVLARACLGQGPTPLVKAITEAQRPRRAFMNDSIGLHWISTRAPGGVITWHNGGTGGFRTWMGCNRTTGTAAVVMTNSDTGVDDLGMHLVDRAVPLRPPSAPRAAVTVDSITVESLVGVYRLAPAFAFTFTRTGTRLFVEPTGQSRAELFAATPTTWFARIADVTFEFERDTTGRATAVTLVQNGLRQRAARAP